MDRVLALSRVVLMDKDWVHRHLETSWVPEKEDNWCNCVRVNHETKTICGTLLSAVACLLFTLYVTHKQQIAWSVSNFDVYYIITSNQVNEFMSLNDFIKYMVFTFSKL
jgi:hypothetical protein